MTDNTELKIAQARATLTALIQALENQDSQLSPEVVAQALGLVRDSLGAAEG